MLSNKNFLIVFGTLFLLSFEVQITLAATDREPIEPKVEELENRIVFLETKIDKIEKILETAFPRNFNYEYDRNFNCIGDCHRTNNLPQNCGEGMWKDDIENKPIQLLKIPNSNLSPFYAFCYIDDEKTTWTIIQRRQDGSEDFNRSWRDYVRGFGNLTGEYWLGLERLHQMTKNQEYELWIRLRDSNGTEKNEFYKNFALDDGKEYNYRLRFGEYWGNAGNSLEHGAPFSTYDKNSHAIDGECAKKGKGGWWYWGCRKSNLNGVYGENRQLDSSIIWQDFFADKYKYVHMAIRPVYGR